MDDEKRRHDIATGNNGGAAEALSLDGRKTVSPEKGDPALGTGLYIVKNADARRLQALIR